MSRDPRHMTHDELLGEVEGLRYRLQAMTHLEFEGAGQDTKTLVDLARKHAPETHRDMMAQLVRMAYMRGRVDQAALDVRPIVVVTSTKPRTPEPPFAINTDFNVVDLMPRNPEGTDPCP